MHRLVIVLAVVAAACGSAAPAAPGAVSREITLAPGEIASIPEASIRIRFLDVPSDSRCPANALCVWAGDAAVRIEVLGRRDESSEYVLHTTLRPKAIEVRDVSIELVQVAPYPFDGSGIPASDYRVTLRIIR